MNSATGTEREPQAGDRLDTACINTIRFLAADSVQKALSGHPGMPMGAAAMAYVLWRRFLRHNPGDPGWPDRDRFVLSAGHGSMLLYALLHLTGYDLPMEELKSFRQWGSRTPGHPESGLTPGVETTTGPLGQGFANAVGMALAERILADTFNRPGHAVVNHRTFAILSDGDLMEGISHEAASLAGHLALGKLLCLWDDNEITIDGSTALSVSDDVEARFRAYGWHVAGVDDGNDTAALETAMAKAMEQTARPSLIRVRTIIGYGAPVKAGSESAHGAPLGEDEIRAAKRNLGWPEEQRFLVPEEVRGAMDAAGTGNALQRQWSLAFERYRAAYPDEAAKLGSWLRGELPGNWQDLLPRFDAGPVLATRAASGKVVGALVEGVGSLVGGSADLTGSNKTRGASQVDFQKETPGGRYLRFGVREHAMAAVCNGMALHGGIRPYCGTFLVFSDYLRPALRLSALMHQPVVYVFTHDSIGVGEDGPTHQPIEHLMALRAIPNLVLIRPCDANETVYAWRAALTRRGGPTALVLTRQKVPTLCTAEQARGLLRGAYIVSGAGEAADIILIATGSEVHLVAEAAEVLREEDDARVRVVSMPSWELFAAQPASYQDRVLPRRITRRVVVEAGTTLGWERYAGSAGAIIGLDRFGASAPGSVLFAELGFSAERIVEAARGVLARGQD